VRSKVRRMAWRYFAVATGPTWIFWHGALRVWGGPGLIALAVGFVAAPLVGTALAFRRPLVRITAGASARNPAGERLAATLSRLGRREDRRLVARLLDRLPLADSLGAGAIAGPVADRAALAAEGLVSLEDAAAHVDEVELQRAVATGRAESNVAGALDRLREGERLRGVLVADLLRSFSRLDLLCLKLARARGLEAQAGAAALAEDIEELRLQLGAEEDLAALLGTKT